MNTSTGKAIGDNIGTTMEVDADEDELAVGLFLRVKVLLDIRKPLLRGVTVETNEDGGAPWCMNFCQISVTSVVVLDIPTKFVMWGDGV